jgi:plastocyanin
MAFDKSTISVYAGSSVTINFDNKDPGVGHNFALYASPSASPPALFQGQVITGPATIAYKFTAPESPGAYFFRCDMHPLTMTGSFFVVGTAS